MSETGKSAVPESVIRILSGLQDAVLVADKNLSPVWCNDAFLHLAGIRRRAYRKAQQEGTSAAELMRGEELEAAAHKVLETGRTVRLSDIDITTAADEALTIMASVVALKLSNDESAVLFTYRDVTAEVGLQERYKRMLERERQRGDELEALVKERTIELELALEEVRRLSRTDALTGLWNRRAFSEHADDTLRVAERHGRSCAIIMVDLDHFKGLNDTFGHQAGDTMLVATAHALSTTVRETDRVGRYGGEEFIIILTELNPEMALEIAERCRAAIEALPASTLVPGKQEKQTASLGVAVFPDHGMELDELVSVADAALYVAKEQGRNQVVLGTAQEIRDRDVA